MVMDSKLGPDDGIYRSPRARSASCADHQLGHVTPSAMAAPSISCTDLRSGGRAARAAPSLCPSHVPPYVCSREQCDELHLCRLYLDGFCPREDDACRWGHAVESADNWNALEVYHLHAMPEHELLWLARCLMRQTAPVSTEEYRRELALCENYSTDAHCGREECFKMHLCPQYVAGRCETGSRCRWTHRLDDPDNIMVLLRLSCANLTEDEVLARLARRPDDGHETASSSSGVCSQLMAASSLGEEAPGSPQSGDGRGDGERIAEASCHRNSNSDYATCTSTPLKCSADSQADAFLAPSVSLLTSLDLCLQNIHPSKCVNPLCTHLHLCRLYAAGICPYGEKCNSGHEPCSSAHNSDVLKRHMLRGVSESDVLKGVREGYLTRHPILAKERQMVLQGCRPYQTGRCDQSDCPRLHVCLKYMQGTCRDQSLCGLSHDLDAPAQAEIIRRIGLDSRSPETILNIFRNPVFSKDVHEALTSGSTETALENCEAFHPQSQMRSSGSPPSDVSSVLLTHSDNSNSRPLQVDCQPDGHSLKTGSAPRDNTPETSVDKSRDVMEIVRTSLDLCPQNTRPDFCDDEGCQQLHLCRFFLAGVCPYGKSCGRGHKPCTSNHNKGVLDGHRITGISEEDLLKSLRSGYLSRNPLTDAERRFVLQVCRPYQTGGCKEEKCSRLHICSGYVMGTCSRGCGLSHQLNSPSHAVIMRRLGLSSLRVKDVLEILRDSSNLRGVKHPAALQKQLVPPDPVTAGQARNLDKRSACDSSEEPCSSPTSTAQNSTPEATDSADTVSGFHAMISSSVAQTSILCDLHSSGGHCDRGDCNGFHVCGYFLANICKRPDDFCPLGHTFLTEHNVRIMQTLGLTGGSAEEFQKLLDEIVLQARIAFRNEAQKEVNLCMSYNSQGGCAGADDCKRFHVCYRFLDGTCHESDCGLLHCLSGNHNQRVRAALGVAAANLDEDPDVIWASDRELIELLRAKMSLNPGIYVAEHSGTLRPQTYSVPSGEEASLDSPDGQAIATLPAVCRQYGTTVGCLDDDCASVHMCPHFLASSCRKRRCRPCTLEHRLSSLHNREVLRRAGRVVTDENHKELVEMFYQSSSHVRRTEVYDRLRLCVPHNLEGCKKAGNCTFIHVCQKFIVGSCRITKGCPKGHCLKETDRSKLSALGLEDASADEVHEMLRAIHSGPSISPNAVGRDERAPSSRGPVANGNRLELGVPPAATPALPSPQETSTAVGLRTTPSAVDTDKPLPAACQQHTSIVDSLDASCADCQEASPSSDGGSGSEQPVPLVCRRYGTLAGCRDTDCTAVHICPHRLAGACRRSEHCQLEHRLGSRHNQRTLRRAGHEAVTLEEQSSLVQRMYRTSAHIARAEVYAKLRVCDSHITKRTGCQSEGCTFIHVCARFVAGTCERRTCREGHEIETISNRVKLAAIGLGGASSDEVLEMLRAVHDWRSVCVP